MPLIEIPVTTLWGSAVDDMNSNFSKTQDILNVLKTTGAFGNTVKASGTIPLVLVGTGSELLDPPDPQPVTGGNYSGYVKVPGLSTIKEGGAITVVGGEFLIGVGGAGKYHTPHAWVDMAANTNAAVVGYIFAVQRAGTIFFSQRVVSMRASAQDQKTNVSGGGFIEVEEGDVVSMWAASSLNTTITLYDVNIGLKMDISAALEAL